MFKLTRPFPASFLEEELGELLAKAYGHILERAFVVTKSFEVFVTTVVYDTYIQTIVRIVVMFEMLAITQNYFSQ